MLDMPEAAATKKFRPGQFYSSVGLGFLKLRTWYAFYYFIAYNELMFIFNYLFKENRKKGSHESNLKSRVSW